MALSVLVVAPKSLVLLVSAFAGFLQHAAEWVAPRGDEAQLYHHMVVSGRMDRDVNSRWIITSRRGSKAVRSQHDGAKSTTLTTGTKYCCCTNQRQELKQLKSCPQTISKLDSFPSGVTVISPCSLLWEIMPLTASYDNHRRTWHLSFCLTAWGMTSLDRYLPNSISDNSPDSPLIQCLT